MDKQDIELAKVQVLADYFHSQFNVGATTLMSITIGIFLLFLTLYYQNVFSLYICLISTLSIFLFVRFYGVNYINKSYTESLEIVEWAFNQVEKGEPLPSINELRKKKITKEKEEIKKEMTNENNPESEKTNVYSEKQISTLSGLLEFFASKEVAHTSFFVAIAIGLFALLPIFLDSQVGILIKIIVHGIYIVLILFACYFINRFKFYEKISNIIQNKLRTEVEFRGIMYDEKTTLDRMIRNKFDKERNRYYHKAVQFFIGNATRYWILVIIVCLFPIALYGSQLYIWLTGILRIT